MSNCCNCSSEKAEGICPVCMHKGQSVKNITVKSIVKNSMLSKVEEQDYFLCINPNCDNVYFNNDLMQSFGKNDVKVGIWFKEKDHDRFICYCSTVTAKEIEKQVLGDNKARTVQDIIRLTGAMSNSKCPTTNPSGKCCHKAIQEVIDETLSR